MGAARIDLRMAQNVPSVHRNGILSSEPYDQLRRLPILNAGERGIDRVARVVLDTDRGQTFRVRVPGDVLMKHALDDGSVTADNVVRRLLVPCVVLCVPLFW